MRAFSYLTARTASLAVFVFLLASLLALAAHRSEAPVVMGRYSASFAFFLAGVAGLAALSATSLLPGVQSRLRAITPGATLLLLASLGFSFGVTEAAFRGLDLLGACTYQESSRYLLETLPDEELKYRHRPGFRAVYQHVAAEFNEMGLRERPLGPKLPGRARILLLGDSVTYGWGVEAEETWGRRLESELSARLGVPVETVNSGVSSYNTVQEKRYFERAGDQIDPDAVILVYVENDVKPLLPLDVYRRQVDETPDAAGLVMHVLRKSWVLRVAYHLVRPAILGQDADLYPNLPGYRASMAALAGLSANCQERGIPFVVFVYRMQSRSATDLLLAEIEKVGKREGFLVADMGPWFKGRNPREVTNTFLDTHPNGEGHRAIAQGIAEVLSSNNVLETRPRNKWDRLPSLSSENSAEPAPKRL